MKYKLSSIILLLVMTQFILNAQNATIKGRIVSFNQQPLSEVNVNIQNSTLGATTDINGHFVIANIPNGTYSLVASSVGYSAIKQNISITNSGTINLDLQLSENKKILQEINITGRNNSYKFSNTSVATRTDAPIIEVPQSAQVIAQQTIKDKQAFSLNEISNVITGVKANNGMGAFSMRGFTGYYPFDASFITYNGIRGNLYLWSQAPLLYNIERVEVLRGPASVLFSEGMPGGIINFVTKKPQSENRFEINTSYGSWNMARISGDITGALSNNKKLLYRAIGGFDRSESFRDYQKVKNVFFAPSIAYAFSSRSSINFELNYAYQKTVQQYDRGVFVKKLDDGSYDFNYYPKNLTVQSPSDFGKTHNTSATLSLNHKFTEQFSVAAVQRYIRNKFNFSDHFVSGAIRNDSINRSYQIWDYDQYSWQTTAYANYKLKTGKITQNLLIGIDYNNFGWSKNDYRNSPSTRISIFRPDYSNDVPAKNPANDYYDDNKQYIHLTGGYVQNQMSFGEKLKLLLSLRHDSYKLVQTPLSERDDLQGDKSDAKAWIPRIGIVYLPISTIAFYGNYNKSFNPQLSNSGGSGGPFPPRTAEQFEVGFKGDFFKNALSTMVSVYDIKYRNILAPDPTDTNPNQQAVVDGTRSKGFELSVQGTVRNIAIIAGYAYNDHLLTANSTLGKKGFRFVNAPRNIANLFAKYNFSKAVLKGLGIGVGGRYMSDQVGFLSTQNFIIPSSTVFDALVNYEVKQFNFQFNLYNLTNTRYFNGGLSRATVAALGNPVNFRLSVNYLIY